MPAPVSAATAGGPGDTAEAINARSWIVGTTQTVPPSFEDVNLRATLWIGLQAFDLNALTIDRPDDVVLAGAADVNDAGEIVGWATNLGGQISRAYLLEPVGP